MKTVNINGKKYEVIEDNRDAFDLELVTSLMTDYFDEFDYVVGDWAYGKLRLKGFYESSNKNCNKTNDIANISKYLEEKCAYGCKWFQIKKND